VTEIDGAKTALRTLEEGALGDRSRRTADAQTRSAVRIGDLESLQAALADWRPRNRRSPRAHDLKADVDGPQTAATRHAGSTTASPRATAATC
jgi:hypothetical protein